MLQLYKLPNSSETHQCFCILTTRLKNALRRADCCQHKHCYPVQLYGLAHIKTQTCNSLYLPFCIAGTRFLKGHNSHMGSQKEAVRQNHQMLLLVLRWILTPSNALPGRVGEFLLVFVTKASCRWRSEPWLWAARSNSITLPNRLSNQIEMNTYFRLSSRESDSLEIFPWY